MARLGGTIYLINRIIRDIFIKLKNKLLKIKSFPSIDIERIKIYFFILHFLETI